MNIPLRFIALCLVALGTGTIVLACDDADDPRATPQMDTSPAAASPTVRPSTPTATAVPADPDLGDRLRYEGEYEEAIQVYAQVASQATGAEQQEARLAQAQLLVRAGREEDARPVLEAHVEAAPAESNGTAAQFMLAGTLAGVGEHERALAAYDAYRAANGVLSEFAAAERAKLLVPLGRVAEAEQAGEAVMRGTLIDEFKATFAHEIGDAFAVQGDDVRAVAWYERSLATPDATPSATLPALGRAKRRLGDPAWTIHYFDAINRYPGRSFATELIAELDEAAVPVSDYLRGLVAYRAFRNGEARDALTRAATAGDHAGEATYYIAALDERAGENEAAIDGYQRSYDVDRRSPQADDALWWRGRLLEAADRLDEASESYARLAREYASSEWHGDAAFRSGLVLYKDGRHEEAAAAWATITGGSEHDRTRARFWQARALMEDDDPRGEQMLEAIVAEPGGAGNFHALRAEVLLGRNFEDQETDVRDAPPNLAAIGAYIAQATGIDAAIFGAARGDAAWAAVRELKAAEHDDDADLLALALTQGAGETPLSLYLDLRELVDIGDESLIARTASLLLSALPASAPPPPDDLLRLAYPLAYGDLAEDAAEEEDVDPLLLLALVRQESYYDPDAGSSAGALGLTQVIPSTGASIADSLDIDDFSVDDLFRPKTSLRFGANYIGSQLENFDGNEYSALAAYNGGPGTASNAIDLAGDDIDLFVEELEFEETRLYVRLVMENYARYRQLYGGIERPSLPE